MIDIKTYTFNGNSESIQSGEIKQRIYFEKEEDNVATIIDNDSV